MRYTILLSLLIFININIIGQYISLEGKQFKNGSSNFYPIVSNYYVSIYKNNDQYFVSSHPQYRKNHGGINIHNQTEGKNLIKEDLEKMKSLGFNTIRLFGFWFHKYCTSEDCVEYYDQGYEVYKAPIVGENITKEVKTDFSYSDIAQFLKIVLQIADSCQMKVIILLGGNASVESSGCINTDYLTYIGTLAHSVHQNKAILAWDLFNEPLYFYKDCVGDDYPNTKEGYCKIVNTWRETIEQYDNNHLFTIGLIGTNDVAKFDPNLMNIDFISIHNYGGNNILRSIIWYSKFCEKPWIIGETAFSAKSQDNNSLLDDNSFLYDDGTLFEQSNYFEHSFDLCYDCMGSGYSVWLHTDVPWYNNNIEKSHSNYYGLTDMYGNNKPSASVMQSYTGTTTISNNLDNCTLQSNIYYNINTSISSIHGKVIDNLTGTPIEGAVISGRKAVYNNNGYEYPIVATTFSNENGEFTLYSNDLITIISGSATGSPYIWKSNFHNNDIVNVYQYPVKEDYIIDNITSVRDITYKAKNSVRFSNFHHANYNGFAIAGSEVNFAVNTTIDKNFTAYLLQYNTTCYSFDYNSLPRPEQSFSKNPHFNEVISYKYSKNKNLVSKNHEKNLSFSVKIYPNPSKGLVNIISNEKSVILEVYNSIGTIILKKTIYRKGNVNLSDYPEGLYIFKLKMNNQVIIKKIMKYNK